HRAGGAEQIADQRVVRGQVEFGPGRQDVRCLGFCDRDGALGVAAQPAADTAGLDVAEAGPPAGLGAPADLGTVAGLGAVPPRVSLDHPGRPPGRWLGLARRRSGPTPHLLRHVTLRFAASLARTISLGSRRYEIVTAVNPCRTFFYAGALRFSGMAVSGMAATDLSLALLGPPVVRRDGAPVTFDTRKATALLALLAVTGREHSREQLADLLWPEADSVKGRASLRRTLSVTAAVMGDGLVVSRAAIGLDPALVRVDVREFHALVGRPDAASLERAASLYRGDFLAGFTLRGCAEFEEWQESVSEELRQALARGLQRLVAACIADGALERAAGHARRWLQLDPLHEPAHQVIIRLHGWAGQRSAAMRQYRSLVRVLDRDLAVRPLPETTRLYDDVRAGRLEPPPVPIAAPAADDPAPDQDDPAPEQAVAAAGAPTWPLVGRTAELDTLRAAWRGAGRDEG